MSHFCVLLFTKSKPSESEIHDLMAPWSEHESEDGKWDWYQVGGRWTGKLGEYDPEKDERNWETCKICGGTGKRDDTPGREQRARDPSYTCNGCDGQGTALKWPTQWVRNEGDQMRLKDIAPEIDLVSYAYVWEEKWEENEEPFGHHHEWEEKMKEFVKTLPKETWVTVVDCHC